MVHVTENRSVTMKTTDRKYLAALRKRYARASKQERGQMLDEYVRTTGCHRKHAIAVLRGKRSRTTGAIRRPRRSQYTAEDARALEKLSDLFDGINAKLLRVALDNELAHLYRGGFLQVSPACYRRLQQISPASIDRQTGRTKPGSLLKSQIPIRTWADWDEDQPGFTEMDLVSHDGGLERGDHAWTLNFTDIKTTWTECAAVRNKAQQYVFEALKRIRARLPFPLRGIDSDNGSEFINDQLLRYAQQEQLTFTRTRPGRKNDNAHVEQKNWSVVRRFVGDLRYDTPQQLTLLHQLYEILHDYVNFFLPTVKLKEKRRRGAKVTRVYERPATPYQRVLADPHIATQAKAKLRQRYAQLDVAALRQQIDALSRQLWASVQSAYAAPSRESNA
jgi:hypothetical protein